MSKKIITGTKTKSKSFANSSSGLFKASSGNQKTKGTSDSNSSTSKGK